MARKLIKDLQNGDLFVWQEVYVYCVICLTDIGAWVLIYDYQDPIDYHRLIIAFWPKEHFIRMFKHSYYLSCANK